MTFPESAIRKRLAQGYRHSNPRNGRGTVMFDEAVEDVTRCLREIDRLLEDVDYRVQRIAERFYPVAGLTSKSGKRSSPLAAGTPTLRPKSGRSSHNTRAKISR